MTRATRPLVLLFLRAPRIGAVKRRLAAGVGEARALAIYRRLGGIAAAAVRGMEPPAEARFLFTPDDAAVEMRGWLGEADWRAQGGGDLGERLARAFAAAFAAGFGPVIAVGSDLPDLRSQDLTDALTALAEADSVLGPAEDGGYWSIGLRRAEPRLFQGISWSTPAVLPQTLERMRDLGMEPRLLRTLRDLDTAADLPPGWS
jgi:uncharacterized protein